jgi:hypothetical protein
VRSTFTSSLNPDSSTRNHSVASFILFFVSNLGNAEQLMILESGAAAAVEVKETCGSQTLCINPPPGGGDEGDIGGTRI